MKLSVYDRCTQNGNTQERKLNRNNKSKMIIFNECIYNNIEISYDCFIYQNASLTFKRPSNYLILFHMQPSF